MLPGWLLTLTQEVRKTTSKTVGVNLDHGVIGAFNEAHDIAAILEQYGYTPRGDGAWLSPGSTSGNPGVRLLEDGRIYSHHADVLGTGHSHDAFSAWTILEHAGNHNRAVAQAAEMLGLSRSNGVGSAAGDLRNARLYALANPDLTFIPELKVWLTWDEQNGYTQSIYGEVERRGKAIADQLMKTALDQLRDNPDSKAGLGEYRHAKYTAGARAQQAMIQMASTEPGMARSAVEYDADPMLLGVANGVLDLRAGALIPLTPEVLVTKRAGALFDPTATCPNWDAFLEEVLPDATVRGFLRRWAGYCLTGLTDAQIWTFLYGTGANGKSVFIEAIQHLMGEYARRIPTAMLMSNTSLSSQAANPDVLLLKGTRFAFATETEEGQRLASARVKEMSGGDTLTGRPLYGSYISFRPTHKLAVVGNHMPTVTDDSYAMWRRVALIEFGITVPPERRDPRLLDRLMGEASGILNWAMAGLQEYLAAGHDLGIPDLVRAATAAYKADQDTIAEWISEKLTLDPNAETCKATLYWSYQLWAGASGHRAMNRKTLTRRLRERGFPLSAGNRKIAGLAITAV